MPTIALDIANTTILVDGDSLTEVSDEAEILQNLWIVLNVHQGEEFYDTEFGIPFADEVMAAGVPPERVLQLYRGKILEVDGINGFVNEPTLDFDEVARKWSLSFRVDSDLGELQYSGPIAIEPTQEID